MAHVLARVDSLRDQMVNVQGITTPSVSEFGLNVMDKMMETTSPPSPFTAKTLEMSDCAYDMI